MNLSSQSNKVYYVNIDWLWGQYSPLLPRRLNIPRGEAVGNIQPEGQKWWLLYYTLEWTTN